MKTNAIIFALMMLAAILCFFVSARLGSLVLLFVLPFGVFVLEEREARLGKGLTR